MMKCFLGMNDFHIIRCSDGSPFRPQQALDLHQQSLNWITEELKKQEQNKQQPLVVITHHPPSPSSIAEVFEGDDLNPAFASDLDYLIKQYDIDVWIHGHTHISFDYLLEGTRVDCNPRGYLPYEPNSGFEKYMVISLDVEQFRAN